MYNQYDQATYDILEDQMIAMLTGMAVVGAIIVIGLYVLTCVGITKMMKAKRMEAIYRGWIPFWHLYILGAIIEEEVDDNSFIGGATKWLFLITGISPILIIIMFFLAFIPMLALQVGLVYIMISNVLLASKYNTIVSMMISTMFGMPFIGYIIIAGRMEKKYQQLEARVTEAEKVIME